MLKAMLFSFFILAVRDYFIAFSTGNLSVVRVMLVTQGVVAVLPYILLILISGFNFKIRTRTQKVAFYWSVCCFLYMSISIVIGIFNGNPVNYILGDAYRFLIPVLMVFSFLSCYSNVESSEVLRKILLAFLIHFFLIVITKLLLLSTGVIYGGGAHQFQIQPFLLSLMLFLLFSRYDEVCKMQVSKVFKNRLVITLFVLTGALLTILSLKREFWLIMLFTMLLVYMFSIKKSKATMFFVSIVLLSVTYILTNESLLNLIEKRFLYTFSGDKGMDASSFERLAEIKGAFFSLFNNFPLGEFFFGLGSGAEFKLAPYYPSVKESTGSEIGVYHHIHNMFTVVFYRFGILGLLLLLSPIFYHFLLMVKNRLGEGKLIFSRAIFIAFIMGLIAGIPANSFYGSLIYGFLIFMSVSVYGEKDERVS